MSNKKLIFLAALTLGSLGLVNAWMLANPIEINPILNNVDLELPITEPLKLPVATKPTLVTEIGHALTRPLFASERRPWTPPIIESPTVAPTLASIEPAPMPSVPPSFLILGIQKISDGSTVLLSHPEQDDAQWYKKGDVIDGWSVLQIDDLSVKIGQDGQFIMLDLYPAVANTSKDPEDMGSAPASMVPLPLPTVQTGAQ